jgi:hypothetical protein
MMKNGQKVESSVFDRYFSTDVSCTKRSVSQTFCHRQFGLSNGDSDSSNILLILMRDRFEVT